MGIFAHNMATTVSGRFFEPVTVVTSNTPS